MQVKNYNNNIANFCEAYSLCLNAIENHPYIRIVESINNCHFFDQYISSIIKDKQIDLTSPIIKLRWMFDPSFSEEELFTVISQYGDNYEITIPEDIDNWAPFASINIVPSTGIITDKINCKNNNSEIIINNQKYIISNFINKLREFENLGRGLSTCYFIHDEQVYIIIIDLLSEEFTFSDCVSLSDYLNIVIFSRGIVEYRTNIIKPINHSVSSLIKQLPLLSIPSLFSNF
jgi:hypothetical protein